MTSSTDVRRAGAREDGFTLIEMLVAMGILMVVCGTVMKGIMDVGDVSRTVSNRTDMHSGVRNATELLTQEIGQAGRISLPGEVTLSAASAINTTSLTVASTTTEKGSGGFPFVYTRLTGTPFSLSARIAST